MRISYFLGYRLNVKDFISDKLSPKWPGNDLAEKRTALWLPHWDYQRQLTLNPTFCIEAKKLVGPFIVKDHELQRTMRNITHNVHWGKLQS